jgi:antitoxin VapB
MATTTTIFKTNQTQAVRLPKAVAFPDDVQEVEIVVVGSSRVISPVGHRWDAFFARTSRISDDFQRGDQGTFETDREPM